MILNKKKLEIAIAKKGLSKGEFAKMAGIHPSVLSHILGGRNISARTAAKITNALGEDLERYIDIYA